MTLNDVPEDNNFAFNPSAYGPTLGVCLLLPRSFETTQELLQCGLSVYTPRSSLHA